MAARSKAWVRGLLAGVAGSNPRGRHGYLSLLSAVFVCYRFLRRADQSSRAILPSFVCVSVISKPLQWGVLGPRGGGAGGYVINHARTLKPSQLVKEFLEFYVQLIARTPCKMLAAFCCVYDVTSVFGVRNLLSKLFLCTCYTFARNTQGRRHIAFITYKVLRDVHMFVIKWTEE